MEPDTTVEIKSFRAVRNAFEIWCLGITVVIGGQYFCWNAGLEAGFGSFVVATILVSFAYISLCLCTSELSSTFPFSGGAYGFCRCALGHYLGFLTGSCECVEYILYVSITFLSLADMFISVAPSLQSYRLLLTFCICLASLVVYLAGETTVRFLNVFLAIVSLLILVMFCLGSLAFVSFEENVVADIRDNPDSGMFVGGIGAFLSILYLPTWFYVGVESLTVTAGSVDNPKITVPCGQVSCILTLFCCAMCVLFICASLPPGVVSLAEDLTPFNRGFTRMFHINDKEATILSIVPTFATGHGFMWAYSHRLNSMAQSQLFPSVLAWMTKEHIAYGALLIGSGLALALAVVMDAYPIMFTNMFRIAIIAAFFTYICQCISYLTIKRTFVTVSREFYSPLGSAGAIYSIFIWLLCTMGIVIYEPDGHIVLITCVLLFASLTLYYHGHAKKNQSFSEEEKKILFTAHVINYNQNKANRVRKGPATAASPKRRNDDGSGGPSRSSGRKDSSTNADMRTSDVEEGIQEAFVPASLLSSKRVFKLSAILEASSKSKLDVMSFNASSKKSAKVSVIAAEYGSGFADSANIPKNSLKNMKKTKELDSCGDLMLNQCINGTPDIAACAPSADSRDKYSGQGKGADDKHCEGGQISGTTKTTAFAYPVVPMDSVSITSNVVDDGVSLGCTSVSWTNSVAMQKKGSVSMNQLFAREKSSPPCDSHSQPNHNDHNHNQAHSLVSHDHDHRHRGTASEGISSQLHLLHSSSLGDAGSSSGIVGFIDPHELSIADME